MGNTKPQTTEMEPLNIMLTVIENRKRKGREKKRRIRKTIKE